MYLLEIGDRPSIRLDDGDCVRFAVVTVIGSNAVAAAASRRRREVEVAKESEVAAVSERGVHRDDLSLGRHGRRRRGRRAEVGALRLLGVGERLVGALVVVGVVAVAGRDEDAADPEHDAPYGVLPAVSGKKFNATN